MALEKEKVQKLEADLDAYKRQSATDLKAALDQAVDDAENAVNEFRCSDEYAKLLNDRHEGGWKAEMRCFQHYIRICH